MLQTLLPDVGAGVAETNVTLESYVSVITTFVASAFPEFQYSIVYVRVLPACTGSGLSLFTMLRTGMFL